MGQTVIEVWQEKFSFTLIYLAKTNLPSQIEPVISKDISGLAMKVVSYFKQDNPKGYELGEFDFINLPENLHLKNPVARELNSIDQRKFLETLTAEHCYSHK